MLHVPLGLHLGRDQFQPGWPLAGFERWWLEERGRLKAADDGRKELGGHGEGDKADRPSQRPAAGTDYTLEVRCAGAPDCVSVDDVLVTVRVCTLAVSYGTAEARRSPSGVVVTWSTTSEHATLAFEVWVRDANADVWKLPRLVMATGSGSLYEIEDASNEARNGETEAYRVRELTGDGPGDATRWLSVADAQWNARPAFKKRLRGGAVMNRLDEPAGDDRSLIAPRASIMQ